MNSTKFISVFAVIMMVATAGIVVIQFTDGSDADTLGTYDQKINVYYYDTNYEAWRWSASSAYNLYEAIADVTMGFGTPLVATGNDSWVTSGNPNREYGKIIGFTGISGNYSIMAFDGSSWQDVTNAPLGWIRPHEDYGQKVSIPGLSFSASANVAIVLPDQDPDDITLLRAMETVAGNNNTLYYFTLHDDTGELNFSGYKTVQVFNPATATMGTSTFSVSGIQGNNIVVAAGYGSDAYLALIDALGTNLVSDNYNSTTGKIEAWVEHPVFNEQNVYQYSYYTYYSWMVSVFGVGTDYDEDLHQYLYWGSYSGTYLQYSFGYYSQLSGAYNDQGSAFQLKYVRT